MASSRFFNTFDQSVSFKDVNRRLNNRPVSLMFFFSHNLAVFSWLINFLFKLYAMKADLFSKLVCLNNQKILKFYPSFLKIIS